MIYCFGEHVALVKDPRERRKNQNQIDRWFYRLFYFLWKGFYFLPILPWMAALRAVIAVTPLIAETLAVCSFSYPRCPSDE